MFTSHLGYKAMRERMVARGLRAAQLEHSDDCAAAPPPPAEACGGDGALRCGPSPCEWNLAPPALPPVPDASPTLAVVPPELPDAAATRGATTSGPGVASGGPEKQGTSVAGQTTALPMPTGPLAAENLPLSVAQLPLGGCAGGGELSCTLVPFVEHPSANGTPVGPKISVDVKVSSPQRVVHQYYVDPAGKGELNVVGARESVTGQLPPAAASSAGSGEVKVSGHQALGDHLSRRLASNNIQQKRLAIANRILASEVGGLPMEPARSVAEGKGCEKLGSNLTSAQPHRSSAACLPASPVGGQDAVVGDGGHSPHPPTLAHSVPTADASATTILEQELRAQQAYAKTSLMRLCLAEREVKLLRAERNEIQKELEHLRDDMKASVVVSPTSTVPPAGDASTNAAPPAVDSSGAPRSTTPPPLPQAPAPVAQPPAALEVGTKQLTASLQEASAVTPALSPIPGSTPPCSQTSALVGTCDSTTPNILLAHQTPVGPPPPPPQTSGVGAGVTPSEPVRQEDTLVSAPLALRTPNAGPGVGLEVAHFQTPATALEPAKNAVCGAHGSDRSSFLVMALAYRRLEEELRAAQMDLVRTETESNAARQRAEREMETLVVELQGLRAELRSVRERKARREATKKGCPRADTASRPEERGELCPEGLSKVCASTADHPRGSIGVHSPAGEHGTTGYLDSYAHGANGVWCGPALQTPSFPTVTTEALRAASGHSTTVGGGISQAPAAVAHATDSEGMHVVVAPLSSACFPPTKTLVPPMTRGGTPGLDADAAAVEEVGRGWRSEARDPPGGQAAGTNAADMAALRAEVEREARRFEEESTLWHSKLNLLLKRRDTKRR